MKIAINKRPITLFVTNCCRCGKDHDVNFFEFEGEGIKADGNIQQYWGICPNNQDPILMHFEEKK